MSGLVGEGADYETDNCSGRDGGQYGVSTIIIMDPVIAARRVIEAPIIIVSYDDRIGVIAVMTSDIIARHIMAIIHISERWPRVIIEWTVSTPVMGARRVAPEIVPTIRVAIVIAIVVTAIIPVEVPVMPIMAVVIVVPVVAIIAIALIVTAVI